MLEKNDWRLQGQEKYLTNRKLMRIPYFRWSKTWDHDHCDFCFATFSEYDGDLHEGYVTADNKRTWICPECFEDFKEMFQWELADAEEAN